MNIIKKKAAAISAVMSYIQEEEEIAYMQSLSEPSGQAAGYAQGPIKLWGINGRQAQMQMRNLMQTKAFHSVKF
jgi:hypothetical protein